jgi:hypothetical protein
MKKMNKSLIVAVFASSGGFSVSALADPSTSASVALGGSVAPSLTMSASSLEESEMLDLSGGLHTVKVADISMITNNEQGLTLTATSGSLTKPGGSAIPFQVSTVVPLGSPTFLVASGSGYTFSNSAVGPVALDLYIRYSPATFQDPGYYDGTINLTVSDNEF